MINKQKVDEILADMKEEERKKQEAVEAEVDKFLADRIEYYVAMVINGDIKYKYELMENLFKDGCKYKFTACKRIEKSLKEYDIYMCYHGTLETIDLSYIDIKKANPEWSQGDEVEKRQIELGLRPDTKKAMDLHRKWVEDEIKEIEKQEESIKAMRKEKNGSSPIPIVFIYLVIVILLILFFVYK